MRSIHKATHLLLLLIFLIQLTGCTTPSALGLPLSLPEVDSASQADSTLVLAPAGATATPTPFQPVPPTAVYLPTDLPTPTFTPPPPTPTPTFTPPPPPPQNGGGNGGKKRSSLNNIPHQVNILLLGADKRPGQRQFRTDTIILATLNSELGTINLTSFPRDLYVNIPNYGMNRINTAYEFGEFKLLAATLEQNFGVRPDHYVLINFGSFKQIVDSLGGLDVEVGQTVSDYRSGRYVTIEKGVVHMDADDALWYARSRKTSNDFARSKRQQEVLRAIVEKLLSLDAIKRAPEFYSIYRENVKSDLSFTDLIPLLPLAAKVTDTSQINHYYIGPQQVYDWITPGGAMVLLPNQDAIMQVLRKALNAR